MAIKFTNHKKVYRFIGLLIILMVISLIFWPQNFSNYNKKILIKPGASLSLISNMLVKEDIVSNRLIFILAAKILGKEKKIPIGSFTLKNAKTNYAIINQLVSSKQEIKEIKILEGWNISQISYELNKVLGFETDDLIALSKNKIFLMNNHIDAKSLEGYLFPDTYKVFVGDTPSSIFNILIKEHNNFWIEKYTKRAKDLKLTKHQIITLASIIEGEAIHDSERAKISGVYHNRIRLNMKLQADPTIQYIIKDGPRRLLNKDLRIESPYNTYLYSGLPPGPINSPGRNSLIAALFPEKNDFIFFVAKGDGYHTFTTNEREHNIAKRNLQKIRRKLKKKKYNG